MCRLRRSGRGQKFCSRAEQIIENNKIEGSIKDVRSITVLPPPKFKEPPRSNIAAEGWSFQGLCWSCGEAGHRARFVDKEMLTGAKAKPFQARGEI